MRDVRVLELAGGPAASYCCRLFASVGGDVVLVEPEGGSSIRRSSPRLPSGASAAHEYLDGGKRSVVIDLDSPELDDAIRWADLVVSTCDGDVDGIMARHDHLQSVNPACVHLVLSGFGLTGPYAHWRHSTLTDWTAGGYLYLTGEPDREPLQGGGPWASFLTGVTGAVGAQAALMDSARTGQGQLVDVGAMEAIAGGHQWSLTMYTHTGAVKQRWGARFGEAYHPMSLHRCKDGNWICIGAPSREQWENFCITVGLVEMLADDDLYTPGARFERAGEIDAGFEPWLQSHTADEAVEALQAARVPASHVLTFAEVLHSEHLAEREYWQRRPDLDDAACFPRAPFAFDEVAGLSTAPKLGADTDAFRVECTSDTPRPGHPQIDLRQVRVLEFGLAWAGPLAGRFLADLGADVLKVEHPTSRGLGTSGASAAERGPSADWQWGQLAPPTIRAEVFPDADPGQRPWNRMGIWNKMNRSKRSLCLDAKPEPGRQVLDRLLDSADLLLHNFTPRGARSLGVDPDTLARYPGNVASIAMTGYGETGPMSTHSSYGPILEAYSGFDEATGYLDHGPIRIGIAFPDAVGGLHGAFAALASLWERQLSDDPVHVDLSQLETLLSFAGDQLLVASVTGEAPDRPGNRSADHAPQGVYRCRGDDAWVAVTVRGECWRDFVDLLDDPALHALRDADHDQRQAQHDDIDAAISRWTATRTAPEAAAQLQARGIAACPAFTNADLVGNEHLASRGFIVTWDQPDVGPRRFPGFPIHFDRHTIELGPAPTLGGDNGAVLHDLGYDDEEIAAMYDAGVIADRPPT